jgi:cyclic-di-GMP-binding protein
MPSFDVVSELNMHEVSNAVDQARRELEHRFDFKDTGARYELEGTAVLLVAPAEFQLRQMQEILKLRLAKRGVDLTCLEIAAAELNLAEARQRVVLRQGIDAETARRIQRAVKDSKLKVQAAIQGDRVRISGKSKDDLQSAMALLRGAGLNLPLQFNNFRD